MSNIINQEELNDLRALFYAFKEMRRQGVITSEQVGMQWDDCESLLNSAQAAIEQQARIAELEAERAWRPTNEAIHGQEYTGWFSEYEGGRQCQVLALHDGTFGSVLRQWGMQPTYIRPLGPAPETADE